MEDVNKLRERAKNLRETIIEQASDRPTFIEFSGSPKSGKSTCIDIVAHFFRRLNFRVLAPTEGASKRTPYYLKDDLVAFNTWSACYALAHVLEGLYHSDEYHIAILDRGLFDVLVWFELLAINGMITREECERVHQFLLIEKWRSVIDMIFFFKADPSTSMERENRDKLIFDPGRAMNSPFLQALNEAYDRIHQRYAEEFPRFEVVDTSNSMSTSPSSTAFKVVSQILDLYIKQDNKGGG
jgi:thymidylate kinase